MTLGTTLSGPQGESPGGLGGGQRGVDRAEVAEGAAAALAGAAVVAGASPLVIPGEHGDAADRHPARSAEGPVDRTGDVFLDAGHPHGRQEHPVGNLRQTLGAPADPRESLDVGVPRSDVCVADRPVHAVTVARVGLEVQVAEPVALAAPHDRPSAHLASADPAEGLVRVGRVRILDVVDEELARHLVAGVALALDGLGGGERLAVVPAAVRHLVGGEMFGVVALGDDHGAGLEDQNAGAQFGELLGRPPARHARADDDGVVFLTAGTDVHGVADGGGVAGEGEPRARDSGRPGWAGALGRGERRAALEGAEGHAVAERRQSHLRGEVGGDRETFHIVEEVAGRVGVGVLAQTGEFRVEVADVFRLLRGRAVREVRAEALPGRRVHRVEPRQEPVAVVVVEPPVHERRHELGYAGLQGAGRVRLGDDDLGQRGHDAGAGRGEAGGGLARNGRIANAFAPSQQLREGARGHEEGAGCDTPQDADGPPSLHSLPYPSIGTANRSREPSSQGNGRRNAEPYTSSGPSGNRSRFAWADCGGIGWAGQ